MLQLFCFFLRHGFVFISNNRRWIILHLHKKFSEHHSSQSFVRPELAVCSRAADRYPDNHTAWSHRGWLLQLFFGQDRKVIIHETRCRLYGLFIALVQYKGWCTGLTVDHGVSCLDIYRTCTYSKAQTQTEAQVVRYQIFIHMFACQCCALTRGVLFSCRHYYLNCSLRGSGCTCMCLITVASITASSSFIT